MPDFPGAQCLRIPYEIAAVDKIDMDDSCVLRLVGDWLDAQPATVRVDLAAYLATHANPADAEG